MVEVYLVLYKETDPVVISCDNFTCYRGQFIYCWLDHKCIATYDLDNVYELSVKELIGDHNVS